MDQQVVIDLAYQALITTLYISAPLLGIGLIVGLAVSIFQATTQIQEQTLAFVPKLVAVLGALVVFGSWMMSLISNYTIDLFTHVNRYIR